MQNWERSDAGMDLQSEMVAEYKHDAEELRKQEAEFNAKMTGAGLRMGCWQRIIFNRLARSIFPVTNPVHSLKGRAKLYQGHYERSFRHLLDRMRDEGWVIERKPGVRGGECTATYRAKLEGF